MGKKSLKKSRVSQSVDNLDKSELSGEDSCSPIGPVQRNNRPIAVMNHAIEPPLMRNGTNESIAAFETAYLLYERKLTT